MIRVFLAIFILLQTIHLFAQEKICNTFNFQNGIYQSFKEFKKNQPSISWNTVTSDLIVMESIHKAKLGHLRLESDSSTIDLSQIWGICINGIPYIKIKENASNEFHTFAGLQLRGHICYYEYEIKKQIPVEISVYNPLTQKPFRSQKVWRDKIIPQQILLNFKTGSTTTFTLDHVKDWIAEDKALISTLKSMPLAEKKAKLLKFIQIFNDRNAVYPQG